MAGNDDIPLRDRDRALELRTDRQGRPRYGQWKQDRLWRVAARSPQQASRRASGADDRVVTPDVHRTVMAQDPVDHRTEPSTRIIVLVRDRLVAHVPTRHHERSTDV